MNSQGSTPWSRSPQGRIRELGGFTSVEDRFRGTTDLKHDSGPHSQHNIPLLSPKPVPVGRGRNHEHVRMFHRQCEELGIMPKFEVKEIGIGQFQGSLTVGRHVSSGKDLFGSEEEAEEALCIEGSQILKDIASQQRPVQGDLENWVGILHEYAAQSSLQKPDFSEYIVELKFACEVTFEGKVFGNKNNLFRSKKEARANAAMEAVLYLRREGQVAVRGQSMNGRRGSARARLLLERGDSMSDGEIVNVLAPLLDLPTPEYRMQQSALDDSHWSGTAHFGKNQASVASVTNVFGKRNARAELANKTLEWMKKYQLQNRIPIH